MKYLLFTLATLSVALIGCKQETQYDPNAKFDLKVTVTNVTNEGGDVYVSVYGEDEQVVAEHRIPAAQAQSSSPVVLKQIASGEYAIFTFQDIDGNKALTMEGSMPVEPLGYSSNAMLMGPPTFSGISFELVENSEKTVQLFDYR